jgi:ribosomal protein S18 acetylase RimI-like enzyme
MSSLVIDVRPARGSDAGELAEVYRSAWREAYSGIIPAITLERMLVRRGAQWWREIMKKRAILVLEVGGAIAGYVSFAPMPAGPTSRAHRGAAEIQELYLAPEFQGIGLGVRLFQAALKRIKSRGYGRVLVRALAENHRANEFYLRRGASLVAQTEEKLGGRTLPCFWYEFRT